MLIEAIQSARSLAGSVGAVGGGSGPMTLCVEHARQFDSREVPELLAWQAEAADFAVSAQLAVGQILAKLRSGAQAPAFEADHDRLRSRIDALSQKAQAIDSHMSGFRTLFNTDVGSMAQYCASIAAEETKYVAQQRHFQAEAASIRTRIDILNGVAVICPLAKAVSELTSLISQGKSTEAQEAAARGNAARLASEAARARQAESLATQLGATLGRLGVAIQNARNAMTIVEAKLNNETAFVGASEEGDAVLYLNALDASIGQLRQLAT